MLRIFIVDDQSSIRIGFRQLDWSQYGCTLVGDAPNGIAALESIANLKPDVVISDIRMPQMDGLELSKMIKRMYPLCSIVLLTGYDEFSFAQQALNIGVDFLLLKPTNFNELESILAKLAQKHTRAAEETAVAPQRDVNLACESILKDIVGGKTVHSGMREILGEQLQSGDRLLLLSVCLQAKPEDAGLMHEYYENIRTMIETVSEEHELRSVCTGTDELLAALLYPIRPSDGDRQDLTLSLDISSRLQRYHELQTLVGFATANSGDDLADACSRSIQALNHAFCSRTNVADYVESEGDPEILTVLKESLQELSLLMYSGNADAADAWFKHSHAWFQENGQHLNRDLYQSIRMDFFSFMLDIYHSLRTTGRILEEPFFDELLAFVQGQIPVTLPGIFQKTWEITEKITQYFLETSNVKNITEMVLFIKEHSDNPDFSLNDLSDEFCLSSSYVSRIISRETGKSFIDHLLDFRIEKAKELLTDKSCFMPNIAKAIGFRDTSYFIHVFKKYVGITPMRYHNIYFHTQK